MRYEVTIFGTITKVVHAYDEDDAYDLVMGNIDEGDFNIRAEDTEIVEVGE